MKETKGGTYIVEILICIPIIICAIFLPISFYQVSQQEIYIEDTKNLMAQQMSRDGVLTQGDIDTNWKPKFEKMTGVTVKSIGTIPYTEKNSPNPMSTTLVFNLKPSIFSFLVGGEYSTKATIYSEKITG